MPVSLKNMMLLFVELIQLFRVVHLKN